MPLPKKGLSRDEILSHLDALQAHDVDWKSGRAFTLAYYAGEDILALATEANARFLSANALNVEAFPSLRKMQSDVIAMVAGLLHGGKALAQRGWVLDQQQPPPSLHCTVNAVHGPVIAEFIAELGACLEAVRAVDGNGPQLPYGTLE